MVTFSMPHLDRGFQCRHLAKRKVGPTNTASFHVEVRSAESASPCLPLAPPSSRSPFWDQALDLPQSLWLNFLCPPLSQHRVRQLDYAALLDEINKDQPTDASKGGCLVCRGGGEEKVHLAETQRQVEK